jgi:hypothetical protein
VAAQAVALALEDPFSAVNILGTNGYTCRQPHNQNDRRKRPHTLAAFCWKLWAFNLTARQGRNQIFARRLQLRNCQKT